MKNLHASAFKDLFVEKAKFREGKTKTSHPLVYSSNALNSQDWFKSKKPGAWNSIRVSYMSGRLPVRGHHALPSKTHHEGAGCEVEQPGFESAPTWDADIPGCGMPHCATMLAPGEMISKEAEVLGEPTTPTVPQMNIWRKESYQLLFE